jgi:hypothetical protein
MGWKWWGGSWSWGSCGGTSASSGGSRPTFSTVLSSGDAADRVSARGFSKNPVFSFEATRFFDKWIDAHDDDGGVLVRVLPFPHDLVPVVVFSHATVSAGAHTHVVAGSLLLLVTGEFVVLVP